MQCVVLAGGLATRLLPVTADTPKYLVPVGGRVFADLQLTWLAGQRVTDVLLCIGHLGAQIREHVGDGRRWGLAVDYVDEGEDLRGTGGALRLALDEGRLRDAFLVLNGDSYLAVDVAAVWKAFEAAGQPALMTVYRNDGRWDRSNVVFGDGRLVRYDKREPDPVAAGMHHIDYGLLALRAEVVARHVPPGAVVDVADVMRELADRGELAGFEVHERFYEIGSIAGRDALAEHLRP